MPLTPATHHLMDARRLGRMRPGAFLYNVSRGAVVDEAALVEALRAGKLAGAGLDVFEEEPLPAGSPLWDLDNVILTPHVAGVTPLYYQRTAALFADNLQRFLSGRPLAARSTLATSGSAFRTSARAGPAGARVGGFGGRDEGRLVDPLQVATGRAQALTRPFGAAAPSDSPTRGSRHRAAHRPA